MVRLLKARRTLAGPSTQEGLQRLFTLAEEWIRSQSATPPGGRALVACSSDHVSGTAAR